MVSLLLTIQLSTAVTTLKCRLEMLNSCINKISGATPGKNEKGHEVQTPTLNERILQECYEIYTKKDSGLVDIAKAVCLDVLPPKREVFVLLLGNHSAGKSSFINWYVGENIQKAGVAIETQGFTFVQHGTGRESLLAESSLFLLPRFKGLRDIPGVLDFLTMEISPSVQRKFSLVTFIDSPGLVDGGMEYPYDVNQALVYLGTKADLVFVFFDPTGQALCKRTLTVIEELSAVRADGLRFVLSKSDEAGSESDRQKVMMQIVQELCTRPAMNRQGFEMKSIYLPGLSRSNTGVNQIEEVCSDIEKAVSFIVQKTLTELQTDCCVLEKKLDKELEKTELKIFDWRALICYFVATVVGMMTSFNNDTANTENIEALQMSVIIFAILLGFIFSNGKSLFYCHRHILLVRRKQSVMAARRRKESLLLEYLGQSLRKTN